MRQDGIAYTFDHIVQRFESGDHTLRILLVEVQLRSFFQPVVPKFVPENGDSDQFIADNQGLRGVSRSLRTETGM